MPKIFSVAKINSWIHYGKTFLWLFSLQKISCPEWKNGCFINHYQNGSFLQDLQDYPASITVFSMLQEKSSINSPVLPCLALQCWCVHLEPSQIRRDRKISSCTKNGGFFSQLPVVTHFWYIQLNRKVFSHLYFMTALVCTSSASWYESKQNLAIHLSLRVNLLRLLLTWSLPLTSSDRRRM